MKSIALFNAFEWGAEYLKTSFEERGFEVDLYDDPLSVHTLPQKRSYDALCVFVGSEVSKEVLDAFENLSVVVTLSTGFNHIDIEECRRRGIGVGYVPYYGEHTVAEFAMGIILTLSRKLFLAADRIKERSDFSFRGLEGFDLKDKTLGVIGTGHIGRHLISMGKGFGMNICAYDVSPDREYEKEEGISYLSFEEVLGKSDIVSLHVPYMKETHHMIGEKELSLMKRGSLLINTARGGLVDTSALVKALQENHLGGAGLDVLEEEGILQDEMGFVLRSESKGDVRVVVANHILMDMDNVIITPHTAFNTREAKKRVYDDGIANIVSFFEKGNVVYEVV